jgi:hypothetical protein
MMLLELPRGLQFDWEREYGPLWRPGSTAFWLEPEPGDLRAGEWPLPFTVPADLPTYNDEEAEWYHRGHRVVAFNWRLNPDGHTIVYADHRVPNGFISDFHMGLCSGRPTVRGYLGRRFFREAHDQKARA